MKQFLFYSFFLFWGQNILSAQKHDYNWLSSLDGVVFMDFNTSPPTITSPKEATIDIYQTCASISDKTGKLVLYSNGGNLLNKKHHLVKNGEINAQTSGYTIVQGTIILPFPQKDSLYLIVHQGSGFISKEDPIIYGAKTFFYSIVDMAKNNGDGEVISAQNPVLPANTFANYGKISAIKQANGIDWWIVFSELDSNKFYRYQLTKDGFSFVDTQIFGTKIPNGVGSGVFSPDGSKFALYNNLGGDYWQQLDVYDFNRCTGLFSNQRHIEYDSLWGAGLSFSPNSRYLYLSMGLGVLQYDMQEADLKKSEINVYTADSTGAYISQLAPDEKIYICPAGGAKRISVINKPNNKGMLCEALLYPEILPKSIMRSFPYFPNFRQSSVNCPISNNENLDFLKYFSISPNPTHGETRLYFNIETETALDFQLFDITGRVLQQHKIPQNTMYFDIQLTDYQNAMYFYSLKDDKGNRKSGKLIKL